MKKYTKYFLFALAFIFAGALQLGGEANALKAGKDIRVLKTGDVVYFDNSNTKWDDVRFYSFNKDIEGKPAFEWNDRKPMTRVGDTNIYKFEITSDFKGVNNNHVIFSGINTDPEINLGTQTIDLGFIETGYAYLVDGKDGDKSRGYWYVYDKSELVNLIRSAEEYKDYSDDLETASNDELIAQIKNRDGVVNGKIKVETNCEDNDDHEYCTRFDISIEGLLKAKLEKILNSNEITNIDRDKYTDESLEKLAEAIKKAEEVLGDPNATPEDIKSATDSVLGAIGNLEEKAPVAPGTPEGTPGETPEGTPGETPEGTPEGTPGETPANPSTFDGIAVAVGGLGIASLAGFALYNKVKQRR